MRVGLISFHSFIKPGGVKRHVLGLKEEFKKRGIYTKIIVPRRSFKENYGKDVILLGTSFPIKFGGSQSDFNINFNPLSIEKILRKEKFDILHFHNFGFPSALQILLSPSALKTLNILTFHSNIRGSKFLKKFPEIIYLLNKICQWKIDGIIGVTPLALEPFKNYKGPRMVIPNGVNLEEFNPQIPKIRKFLDGKINILFVGRLEERKGLIYLLKAYKILKKKFENLRLIIVGEGEKKKEGLNFIRKNKLKDVFFEGEKTGSDLPPYYSTCDIFCSPAIFGESFGIVLLEAMACRKPVVAFDIRGYKEVLSRKGARFLAKPKDYKTLAKKIEILIKNKKLRKEMGQWGIREAKKYSWPKVVDRVLNFYHCCQKNKERERKNSFSIEKMIEKTQAIANKDVLNWLKNLKFKI